MVEKILVENEKEAIAVSIDDLLYITTTKQVHYLKLVTLNGNFILRGTLMDFENKYSNLVRCHRQAVVNIQAIKEIDKQSRQIYFFTNTTETCPISRRIYKKLHADWRKLIYSDSF
ncbi:MAG: LytTR family DNA-binding domain-containing protein [Lentilactobacillus diolivorans]